MYRTADLYLAAFLKARGISLLKSEKEGHRIFFCFDPVQEIADLQRSYFDRTGEVAALTYGDEIRALKALTYL